MCSSLGQGLDDDGGGGGEFFAVHLVLRPCSWKSVANAHGRHVAFAVHAVGLPAYLVPRELHVDLFRQSATDHEPYDQLRPDGGRYQIDLSTGHQSLVKLFGPVVVALQHIIAKTRLTTCVGVRCKFVVGCNCRDILYSDWTLYNDVFFFLVRAHTFWSSKKALIDFLEGGLRDNWKKHLIVKH